MAGTSVLKLKVDDKEYNSSLKQAQQGIQHLEQALNDAGKTFKQVDKSVVDYVRGIGQMEAQSKTARGRISEMSNAFVELSLRYKNMSDEVKSSDVGKALAESMQQLKNRTIEAKSELEDLNKAIGNAKMPEISTGGGDGLSSMMAVFGGNMMTKGVELLTSAMSRLGDEIVNISQAALEMSVQAEGITIAFNRLNDPNLLNELREATHGTVSDLELMKAAVKFDDFNLPLKELGTMLAFAQKKAKDTGQSVDYMVDSIVTGLGRKSLMILDNLGLSAAEIKKRMGENGDMTIAVGEIIREQMESAGDYMETAADRGARANAELENSYLRLGNKMRETFGIGSVEELNSYIKQELVGTIEFTVDWINETEKHVNMIIDLFDELKDISPFTNAIDDAIALITPLSAIVMLLDKIRGDENTGIGDAAGTGGVFGNITPKPEHVYTETRSSGGQLINATRNGEDVTQEILRGIQNSAAKVKRGRTGASAGRLSTTPDPVAGSIDYQTKKVQELQKAWRAAADDDSRQRIKAQIDEAQHALDIMTGKVVENPVKKITAQEGIGITASVQDKGFLDITPTKIITPLQALEAELARLKELQEGAWTTEQFQTYSDAIDEVQGKIDALKGIKDVGKDWKNAAQAISQVGSALSSIQDPAAKVLGIIAQAIASVALGFAQATSKEAKGGVWAWIAAVAAGLGTMISTISAIHSATGYAQGGIVDGRGGGFVPGTQYSGDNVGNVRLDSGELVLNRAMQSSLASQLQDNADNTQHIVGILHGTDIWLSVNRTTKRQGLGEIVTW
jgi:seryl-tRNA synthetase